MAAKKKTPKKAKATAKAKAKAKTTKGATAAKRPKAKKPAVKKKSRLAAKRKTTTAATTTPKTSELRGVSVETWSKKLQGWHVDALRLIRAIVARHAPTSKLGIKWGQPVWEHNGPFAWARPAATHLSFGFWRGAEMDDPSGVLEGDGTKMRHVKITSAEHINQLPLEAFVKEAIRLNEQKGDPTKPL